MKMRLVLIGGATLAVAAACGGNGDNATPSAHGGDASSLANEAGGRGSDGGDDTTDDTTTGDATTGGADSVQTSDAATDAWAPLPPTPLAPQLWYWHHSYLSPTSTTEPAHSEQLVDQAAAAGYTGLAFWDSSLTFANRMGWDTKNLATVVGYAKSKGLAVLASGAPYGYSNDMLQTDPNLAEGAPIVGGVFKVAASANGGSVLQPVNTLPPIANPGFEAGKTVWFNIGDARLDLDATVAHTGSASGVIHGNASATDNARFTQSMTLTPWRLYHVELWFKTAGFSGNTLNAEVLDFKTQKSVTLTRLSENPPLNGGDQNWTVFDYAFNSQDSTNVTLYLGIWGGFSGTVWIDDVVVEESALVNVLRRGGTPLKVYDATTTYTEGSDYANVADPALAARPGKYDPWHAPPAVAVPAGSKLRSGQTVAMDYYTVVPVIGYEVGACWSEPAVQQWNHDNAAVLKQVFPAGSGVFMDYDEARQGDSCELCRSKNMTAGQLLAWNVQQTVQTLQSVWGSDATFYFWDDMFNPYHNAVANYYDVEGDLAGSWAGLPPRTTIMQWNLGNLTKSLTFFSGTDMTATPAQPHAFQQIIAGYYDSGNGTKAATDELSAARGIHGVAGLMYTSWKDDYSQMKAYADAAKAAWPAYQASTP